MSEEPITTEEMKGVLLSIAGIVVDYVQQDGRYQDFALWCAQSEDNSPIIPTRHQLRSVQLFLALESARYLGVLPDGLQELRETIQRSRTSGK